MKALGTHVAEPSIVNAVKFEAIGRAFRTGNNEHGRNGVPADLKISSLLAGGKAPPLPGL